MTVGSTKSEPASWVEYALDKLSAEDRAALLMARDFVDQ